MALELTYWGALTVCSAEVEDITNNTIWLSSNQNLELRNISSVRPPQMKKNQLRYF